MPSAPVLSMQALSPRLGHQALTVRQQLLLGLARTPRRLLQKHSLSRRQDDQPIEPAPVLRALS